MKDDTGRPGSGDNGIPVGTRARNRTMIMGGDERVSSVSGVGERDAPVSHHDDFQSLDEIFGTIPEEPKSYHSPEAVEQIAADGAVSQDASSTLMSDLGLDDDFQSVLDVFEPAPVISTPVSAPKIVRSSSGNLSSSPRVVATDVFDPFAAMEYEDEGQDALMDTEQSSGTHQSDRRGAFEHTPDHDPHVEESLATPMTSPSDGMNVANERLIIPSSLHQGASPVTAKQGGHVVPHEPKMSIYQDATDAELMTEPRDHIYWKNESPLVGFLVTYDHDPMGSYVELRQGRLMVSNQREESGSCFVVIGKSVSPMHAIMRVTADGGVQVLDQLSESGTRVKRAGQREEEFLSGEKSSLSHGDIVFFGDRKFYVLLVISEAREG